MSRTKLTEVEVSSLDSVWSHFGEERSTVSRNVRPLVLTVQKSIFRWWTVIPAGVSALVTRFGKLVGEYAPGMYFLPFGTHISFIVNKHYIPFDITVTRCPTMDNVMVSINMQIVFQIKDAIKFVYGKIGHDSAPQGGIGADKLSSLMTALAEETVRTLARGIKAEEIYNLRSQNSTSTVATLSHKLEDFGIAVSQVNITRVTLPAELSKALENETSYTSRMREQRRNQSFQGYMIDNSQGLKNREQERQNERLAEAETFKKDILTIQKEASEIEAQTKKRKAEVDVERQAEVTKIHSLASLDAARLEGEKISSLRVIVARGQAEAQQIQADSQCYAVTLSAEAQLHAAEDRAHAVSMMADAEAVAASKLKAKRAHVIGMKKLDILRALGESKTVYISGSCKDDPLAQVVGRSGGQVSISASSARASA